MVSDAFDVGQIFFNAARLTEKIEIIPGNPGLNWVGGKMVVDDNSDLGQLLSENASEGHRLYGETLKMFFSQDKDAYNFDKLKQFYLIHYKGGTGHLDIIGGTSPATLFFSSANNLNFIDIAFGQDKLFDQVYCPLHQRSEGFILFMYSLQKAIPQFSRKFGVINAYLEASLRLLSPGTKNKVVSLTENDYQANYVKIPIAGVGDHPEIIGHELRGVKVQIDQAQEESDFVIAPTETCVRITTTCLTCIYIHSQPSLRERTVVLAAKSSIL